MKHALLIINPFSGKRRAPALVDQAKGIAAYLEMGLSVVRIEGPGHGTELAKTAIVEGYDRVIVAGGDGTLNAVAKGLIGTEMPLGIVARGSGNGYARSLKLPNNLKAALELALTGDAHPVDTCTLNGHPFLGTAGIGFDARVAKDFDESKARGPMTYARLVLRDVRKAGPMVVRGHIGDHAVDDDLFFVCFANTTQFGNGAQISPGSLPDDGIAELQLVRKPVNLKMISALLNLYSGNALNDPHITSIPATSAVLWQEGTLAHVDGEPLEVGHDVRFEMVPKSLLVVRKKIKT